MTLAERAPTDTRRHAAVAAHSAAGRRARGRFGAGGRGLSVAGHDDDDPRPLGRRHRPCPGDGSTSEIPPSGAAAIIAIGDNAARKRIADRLDLDWVTVVHPFSWLHPEVPLGPGTVVCSSVSAQVGADIGAHTIINNGSGVGHDAQVGDFVHLAVSHVGAESRVDEGAFLEFGSVVLPRLIVGAWAMVGAGAVVMAEVRPGATVIGNPARETVSDRDMADVPFDV